MNARGTIGRIAIAGIFWKSFQLVFGPVVRLHKRLSDVRTEEGRVQLADRSGINEIFREQTVLHGPFAGMRYPGLTSLGSSLYPKLLGCYEREIAPLIEELCQRDYDTVIDVGCAEGYYAVGLGMRMPGARILAFDSDPQALLLTQEMARLNRVFLEVHGFCSSQTLETLDLGRRALIVSDCEGYETELFDEEVARILAPHDLLIETHDFIRLDITQKLLKVFEPTHRVSEFHSVDDIIKAYDYEYEELEGLDLAERMLVLAEYRPAIMRWLFFESRCAGS